MRFLKSLSLFISATFTFHITDGRLHKGRLETHAIEGYCYSLISDYSEAKFYEQNVSW